MFRYLKSHRAQRIYLLVPLTLLATLVVPNVAFADMFGIGPMLSNWVLDLVVSLIEAMIELLLEMTTFLVQNSLLTTPLQDAMPGVYNLVSTVAREVTGPLGQALVFFFIALRFGTEEEEATRGSSEDRTDSPEARVWIRFFIIQALVMHTTELIDFIFTTVNLLITLPQGGLM